MESTIETFRCVAPAGCGREWQQEVLRPGHADYGRWPRIEDVRCSCADARRTASAGKRA